MLIISADVYCYRAHLLVLLFFPGSAGAVLACLVSVQVASLRGPAAVVKRRSGFG
jgi:hypothetical protein